jgi:peptide/nickel transport system substrate-binding protein
MTNAKPLGQRPMQDNRQAWSRRRLLALAGAGAAAFGMACGTRKSGGAAAPAAGHAGKPKYGGELNLATVDDPGNGGSFDPANKRSDGIFILGQSNNSLLGFKLGSGVKYTDVTIQPELAARWEAPDGITFTFHLHPNVHFANVPPVGGRQMTSADVKWAYEYLSGTGALKGAGPKGAASLFTGLQSIETPDASTVVVRFSDPFAPFITYVATDFTPILAHEIFDQDGTFAKRLAGTGPFQLDTAGSQPGKRWQWKKNTTYFQQGLPYLDQINWIVVPDDATQEAAFETKQLDVLTLGTANLTLDTVDQVKKVAAGMVVYPYPDRSSQYFYLNVSRPPLDDARVRQAMGFSINRDEFIKTFGHGNGQWALAASQPGLFTEQETKQILKYDPAQAKQLLAASGHAGGVAVEIVFTKSSDQLIALLQLLQAQLKQTGINLKLTQVESGVDSERRRTGDYQMSTTADPPGESPDPDSVLYPLFYPNDPGNRGKVDDPQLTPLLVAQRRETDPAKRRELIRQAVRRINEVPWAFALYYGTAYEAWWPYVKNYAPNTAVDHRFVFSWLQK